MNGWRIFNPKSKSYYVGMSEIGPRFEATREAAAVFKSAYKAVAAMGHWAFAGCRLELPSGKLQSRLFDRAPSGVLKLTRRNGA